jgi:hypothetical protein
MVTDADRAAVAALLGRVPEGTFEIIVRDEHGAPVVIANEPFLGDGRPMPTRYWLVGKRACLLVSRLETAGGVRRAEAELGLDVVGEAHDRYAAERNELIDAEREGPRPSGGVGGTRVGVKCLHAHYAWFLAGGDDPVGRWVDEHLHEGEHPHGR